MRWNWAEVGYVVGAIVLVVYVFTSTLTDFGLGAWLSGIDLP